MPCARVRPHGTRVSDMPHPTSRLPLDRLSGAIPLVLTALVLTACSGLKDGQSDAADSGASTVPSSAPSSSSSAEAGTPIGPQPGVTPLGPGFYGALPNGYCCTQNEDCRSRDCVDGAGGRMCRERCTTADGCLDTAGPFTCKANRCEPEATTQCVPSGTFQRGTKKLGECCLATHDGRAGLECEGGRCDAFGADENPYICSQACKVAADCPGPFMCIPGPYDFKICVPEAKTYTCK